MATKANETKGRSRKSKRMSRMIIFSVEILVILVMLLVVVKVFQMTDPEGEGGSAGPNIFDPVRENPGA